LVGLTREAAYPPPTLLEVPSTLSSSRNRNITVDVIAEHQHHRIQDSVRFACNSSQQPPKRTRSPVGTAAISSAILESPAIAAERASSPSKLNVIWTTSHHDRVLPALANSLLVRLNGCAALNNTVKHSAGASTAKRQARGLLSERICCSQIVSSTLESAELSASSLIFGASGTFFT
jgi:hypothetical protein